jgi:hypothetical protein
MRKPLGTLVHAGFIIGGKLHGDNLVEAPPLVTHLHAFADNQLKASARDGDV